MSLTSHSSQVEKKGMVVHMYKILQAEELTTNIYLMVVEAKRVAKSCQPGQFIIVRMDEEGERIPLTICDYDREKGTVTIVFQIVGAATQRMSALKTGDSFHDFVGPLGCPSEFVNEKLESLKKKKKKIISKIEKGKFQLDICLLVLSDTEKNQLEIIDPNLFLQKNYPRREYFVVGIAKGFDEALEILEEITKNVYNETKGADIRSYILNKEQEG